MAHNTLVNGMLGELELTACNFITNVIDDWHGMTLYLKGARNPRRISDFMKKQCVASLTQLQNRYPLAQRIVHPPAA